ncbi:ABC transporter substrate-binding protein [Hominifimenecus sp. rT4P-3]|uniref:ABC transporter substrate-binding protein n=1 Tax=Hominifimenecus sp. rT4P-3 TaxID=3242979 RepID=UPI003DA33A69
MKRWLSILLSFVMAASLTACNGSTEPTSPTTAKTAAAEVTSAETTTAPEIASTTAATGASQSGITLTDQGGRQVTLEKPAESVVSCYYITSYAMISLGLTDHLVGVEDNADKRPAYSLLAPELLTVSPVGSLKEFNLEAAAALKPDLILLPKKLWSNADTLTGLGISVIEVNPESHEELVEMLYLIAKACGKEEKAAALEEYYNQKQEEIQKLTANLTDDQKPVVYLAGNSDYMETAPAAMYQATLIDAAGGVNAAKDVEGDYWTKVSYEQILAMNPDIIIIPCAAKYTAEDILKDKQFAQVTAVKNQAIYHMPTELEEWDSPVPSGILGNFWMLAVLHEDLYSMDEMQKEATEFYQNFYGTTIDAKTLIGK